MPLRRPSALGFFCFLIGNLSHVVAAAPAGNPPNIVVIFIDDMGYADIGPFGAKAYPTPHLDRLAKEGRVFTDFYASQPVCSASRASLLTGCYSNRIGIHGALGPKATHGLHAGETTLAEVCKQKGYATAIFGKWHLGHHEKFLPLQHGFDEYFGLPYSNDMWPFHPAYADLPTTTARRKRGFPDLPLFQGNTIVNSQVTGRDQALLTQWCTKGAVDFIKRNKERPFFVYVPHSMVHVPLFVSDDFKGKSGAGLFGDVVMELDWSVGQILATLKETGVDDNTLVVFTADNGPWLSYGDHAGSALPLREGKGTTWDGGVREPTIARWPGRIPAGTVCREPAMTIDLLPTIAHLIGAELPSRQIDGKNIWPLFSGEENATSPHDAYFFYYHKSELQAMRAGRWKLHFPHRYRTLQGRAGGTNGRPVKYSQEDTGLELYDLSADIGETVNVAARHPDVIRRLTELANAARAELGDSLRGVEGRAVREPGRL